MQEIAESETVARKTCSSCGSEFGCGAKAEGCWCTQMVLSEETANVLRSNYEDCLCPACLASVSEGACEKR